MQIDIYEVKEGGLNTTTHKFTGRTRCSNFVLKRGVAKDNELFKWYQNCINGKVELKSGAVIMMDSANVKVKRWNFIGRSLAGGKYHHLMFLITSMRLK